MPRLTLISKARASHLRIARRLELAGADCVLALVVVLRSCLSLALSTDCLACAVVCARCELSACLVRSSLWLVARSMRRPRVSYRSQVVQTFPILSILDRFTRLALSALCHSSLWIWLTTRLSLSWLSLLL